MYVLGEHGFDLRKVSYISPLQGYDIIAPVEDQDICNFYIIVDTKEIYFKGDTIYMREEYDKLKKALNA